MTGRANLLLHTHFLQSHCLPSATTNALKCVLLTHNLAHRWDTPRTPRCKILLGFATIANQSHDWPASVVRHILREKTAAYIHSMKAQPSHHRPKYLCHMGQRLTRRCLQKYPSDPQPHTYIPPPNPTSSKHTQYIHPSSLFLPAALQEVLKKATLHHHHHHHHAANSNPSSIPQIPPY